MRIYVNSFRHQCGYAFVHEGNLRRHLANHFGEKPFHCNLCDYACAKAGNLGKHVKTHSGEKSHTCSQCDYASVEAGNLRRRLKYHSGENSYNCNQCEFQFVQRCDLERRLKIHSIDKWYKCTDFDFKYAEKWHLKTLLEIFAFQKLQAFQTNYKINPYWHCKNYDITTKLIISTSNFWTKAIKFGFFPRWTREKSAINPGKLSYVIWFDSIWGWWHVPFRQDVDSAFFCPKVFLV